MLAERDVALIARAGPSGLELIGGTETITLAGEYALLLFAVNMRATDAAWRRRMLNWLAKEIGIETKDPAETD